MFGHISNASCPVGDGEVGVSPPSVSICCTAAPSALGNMVVEVNVDLIGRTLRSDGIKDLSREVS